MISYLQTCLIACLISLLNSLLERAALQEEQDFPCKAFGQLQTFSLWKVWLMDGSKSVEALMETLT